MKRTIMALALAMAATTATAADHWMLGASTNSDHTFAIVGDRNDVNTGALAVWFDPAERCEPLIEHSVTAEAIASDSLLAWLTGSSRHGALGQRVAASLRVDTQLVQQTTGKRFQSADGYAVYRLGGDTSGLYRQLRAGNRVSVHFPATSENYGYSLNRSRAMTDYAEARCRKLIPPP
jgi:hypothetical protein